MTGTPLDLTPFGPLLKGIGLIYWALAALGLWWALRGSAPWQTKLLRVIPVVLLFGFVPGRTAWNHMQARGRLDAAMALFEERCKGAGEKITQVVSNVDGVAWVKWRSTEANRSDQFKLDDPYGHDCYGEECIRRLLRVTKGIELNPMDARQHATGYRFVETIDPLDSQRYRYVATMKLHPRWTEQAIAREKELTGKGVNPSMYVFSLEREPIGQYSARFGIAWDDVSTRDDRVHWIAGGSLKAFDLQTHSVVAERVGYLIDPGLGSTGGFRDPWGWARSYGPSCPQKAYEKSWDFVIRVLQPSTNGE